MEAKITTKRYLVANFFNIFSRGSAVLQYERDTKFSYFLVDK